MSYASPGPSQALDTTSYYSSTPPAPPPKPSTSSTPAQAPPLPPPPPQHEPLELDGGQGGQYQYQGPPAPQQAGYNGQHSPAPFPPGGSHYQESLPHIPAIQAGWLPESVRDMTTTDLHHLLQTPSLQHALLANPDTTHPSIPAAQVPLRPLLDQNITLTSSVGELESSLTQQRASTQSRLLSLRALEQQHASKLAETESALSQFSPMALYQRLNAGVAEQDLLLRGIEDSWLDEDGLASEREVESFVRQVKDAAKKGFLRRERKERWDEGRVGGWR